MLPLILVKPIISQLVFLHPQAYKVAISLSKTDMNFDGELENQVGLLMNYKYIFHTYAAYIDARI